MSKSHNRMPLIDALKGLAAQIILLHHMTVYGPLAETARELAPMLSDWLFDYGRMAVQIFLVIAGFLAARSLSPNGESLSRFPLHLIWKRYLRLSIPFLMAISVAIVCAAIADRWLDDEMVPARATALQWFAHALLVHGVSGVDSLSAGVWYIAIDFQLFALFALVLWAGWRNRLAPAAALLLGIASLFWFNRQADWDNWAVYFFGSYMLGAAAWWASDRRHLSFWLGIILTVTIAALLYDFRLRIAVALVTALVLGIARRTGMLQRWPDFTSLAFLGQISYSVFLIHFPVLLLANTVFDQIDPSTASGQLIGLGAAWLASVIAGIVFYRYVEHPAASLRIQTWIANGSRFVARPLLRLSRQPD